MTKMQRDEWYENLNDIESARITYTLRKADIANDLIKTIYEMRELMVPLMPHLPGWAQERLIPVLKHFASKMEELKEAEELSSANTRALLGYIEELVQEMFDVT